jgi:coatomer subunit beta
MGMLLVLLLPAQVVMVLKKEIMRTQSADAERGPEYRQMLVAAIHSCAVKFPEVASSVVHLLMDFLGDPLVRPCCEGGWGKGAAGPAG